MVCSHIWINPQEAPIERAPYSPVIGDKRREMKVGVRYVCQRCGMVNVALPSPRVSGFDEMLRKLDRGFSGDGGVTTSQRVAFPRVQTTAPSPDSCATTPERGGR